MAQGEKVLIIDDEEDLRENLKFIFRSEGYDVELAEDGIQGLKKLESFSPDLIILDINMPNMGGIEFYQRICDNGMPRYPVFVLTARANMEQFFKDFNVDGFMAKPFEIPDLVKEAGIVIEKHKMPAYGSDGSKSYKNVFIVEDDEFFCEKAGAAFLMEGMTVNLAKSGAEAIERISKTVPDVVFVKMKLPDIAGDIVIMKLKRLAKTAGIRKILYVYDPGDKMEVSKKIGQKEGVDEFIVANSAKDLIKAIK